MPSFRVRTGILLLALIGWLPFVAPARGTAQEGPPTAVTPDCTAATTNAETVPPGGNPHVTHWVTLDPYQGCNWHVEVVGGAGWLSNVAVGVWSWRTVEFAVSPNSTSSHRSATVRILAGTTGGTQLATFQVDQDPGCTGFGDPQLNNPNPPEGGGGFGALVPLYPNMDCRGWAVSTSPWIHVTDVYNTLRGNQWYGHFFYTIDANASGAARSTNVMVYQPGTSYESPLAPVHQPPCTYGITGQPQQTLPGEGGTYSQMQVTTQTGCPSQPAQKPDWVHFPSQSPIFDYDRNGPAARSGQLAFGAQSVPIQQAPTAPETYRITSKGFIAPSHVSDPLPPGHSCDGGVDDAVWGVPAVTWLRGDNHSLFDPAPDGAFSGPGLNGTADARTLDQVEFTWDGSHFSNLHFFHNIGESHRDFSYRHGDLFFSCQESGQANTPQSGVAYYLNGQGHVDLGSSVAIPRSLVDPSPTLDTSLKATIDVAHNLTLQWDEDPWTQGYRVERKRPDGSWMPLKTHITSNASCIDLYGVAGALEAGLRLNSFLPFSPVRGSLTFNLPAITQTQPEQVEPCIDPLGHPWSLEPCSVHTLLPSRAELGPQAQQGRTVIGTAWPSCTWIPTSDASWLTPDSPIGSGSGYALYNVAANPTAECRYGSITYTIPNSGTPGKLSVTQLGLGPAVRWNAAADFRPEGLSNPAADCHGGQGVWEYLASDRTLSRAQTWTLPDFRHDNDCSAGSRSYWKNYGNCDSRISRVGSRLFLTPSWNNRSALAWHNPGPAGYFNVAGNIRDEAGHGGHWYIDKGAAALTSGTLSGGATQAFSQSFSAGAGETVLFTYEDDPGYGSEASLDLTVTPTFNPSCTLNSINPFDVYLNPNAHANQPLTINAAQAGCPFTAQSSSPGLTIAGADPQGRYSGVTGAGGVATLIYSVSANPDQYREMTILVTMGATTRLFTVHQDGANPCQVTDLNMYYQTVDSGAHDLDVVVTTTAANCSFTATRPGNDSWLILPLGGASYTGTTGANRQATLRLHVAENQGAERITHLRFTPTQGQTQIELQVRQRAYAPPSDPCAQGWSSDSYVPDDLVFVGGAGGPVQFRVLAPAGCAYKAIERCGTYCSTNSPRLDSTLPSHTGAYVYNTHVPGLACNGGNTRTTYVDVKTANDNRTRDTIVIFQTCASDTPGNPGTVDGADNPTPEPADPDLWNNGSCLPPREGSITAGPTGTGVTAAPPTIEEQVDALAGSLAKQYRERRAEILATSSDPKGDLNTLEKDIAAQFEQGTIDIYNQASLPSPFDPGCQPAPADTQPAKP